MIQPHTSRTIRILYYGASWPANIGNAFIDLGAMALLRAAAPDAQIAFASEVPRWLFWTHARKNTRWWRHHHHRHAADKALDMATVSRCDLVVLAGMAMCEEFLETAGPPIQALARRGVPVLMLGTGGLTYDDQEKTRYGKFLQALKPLAFIARDDRSYDTYAALVDQAYRGIDCGFFVDDAYTPLPLVLDPYVVAAFDFVDEPHLTLNGHKLVRAHHDCRQPLSRKHLRNDHTLISDIPHDYLTLYANAEQVHSDRVHACVAALAYGRPARLYHPTPRGSLFAAVGAHTIRDQLTTIDQRRLAEAKAAQIECVRELIAGHLK